MLHLQPHNLLIQKTLTEAIEAVNNGTPLTLDRIVSDFDYTTFHISNSDEEKSTLLLSVKTKAWASVVNCGDLLSYLQSSFTKFNGIEIPSNFENGYNYTLALDLKQLDQESVVQASLLKTMIMSFPFNLSFEEFNKLSSQPAPTTEYELNNINNNAPVFKIEYRDDENIFIKPSFDRITVIFETIFQDETDKILGKVFLQEFVDARKRNRGIQSAPQVLFSHEPPLELRNLSEYSNYTDISSSKRFITFVLFPRHFANDELKFKSVVQLTLFRSYFHYHIKCSKAYLHSRMRYRVDTFVKVLNRAKVDEEEDSKDADSEQHVRRTITGRKVVY
ncbi:hypothetical protein KAFR_0C04660 [Kazachstania africana CBS 2517]|uniref:Arp2/3 complex 34 kDa subunit n=1 Tax=Kazachstania africana (strain ATCC 22294 / BCRC 22015 / CBS 2517 / CECT 1963 / NBRC 1671 / NRRL Y-8276) TaxID=1071382 RepID=H2ASV7_KAZAF|nr:hypothetical protein KAFR_0C04660 [Kazachstania africana CBS 2517]CCF57457.1 hypothetical protein KAFR_0C04660 [Kazachstania africana CBS 2517]